MKIKTRWDAVNYLEKIENELDEVCNNNCKKCPFNKAIFFPDSEISPELIDKIFHPNKGIKVKIMKYQKKPIVIEAIQWTGNNFQEIEKFVGNNFFKINVLSNTASSPEILIPTLEGVMKASIGDFIIKGIQGECYHCKPDIFRETYQPIEEGD